VRPHLDLPWGGLPGYFHFLVFFGLTLIQLHEEVRPGLSFLHGIDRWHRFTPPSIQYR